MPTVSTPVTITSLPSMCLERLGEKTPGLLMIPYVVQAPPEVNG